MQQGIYRYSECSCDFQIINRITSMPRNIMYSFDGSVITLHKGSKLYKPNGDFIITDKDYVWTVDIFGGTNASGDILLMLDVDNTTGKRQNLLYVAQNDRVRCGDNHIGSDTEVYWNQTVNKIYWNEEKKGTWIETDCTLPFLFAHRSGGVVDRINCVFDNYGIMGNAVFILPGIRGLAPFGKDENGQNLFTEVYCDKLISRIFSETANTFYATIFLGVNSIGRLSFWNYDKRVNYNINPDTRSNNGYNKWLNIPLFTIDIDSNSSILSIYNHKYQSLLPDYMSGEFLASQAFPSDKYIDLTEYVPETSGTISIAMPCNGWLVFRYDEKLLTLAANKTAYVAICDTATDFSVENWITTPSNLSSTQGTALRTMLPVRQRATIQIYSTINKSSLKYCRLILPQGVSPVQRNNGVVKDPSTT